MGTTSLPFINAQLLAAANVVGPDPYRILITGQIPTTGTAVEDIAYEDIERKTNTEIETLFGVDSEFTTRIKRARSIVNGLVPLVAIGKLFTGTGFATKDLLVTGAATADGTLKIAIIDETLFTVNVSVLDGDVPSTIAAAIDTAIGNLTNLPASNAVVTATVTLTANDTGTLPNKYTAKVLQGVPGVAITDGQFASGAVDPTLTGIFDNVQATRFHAVLWPWGDDFTDLDTFLSARNVVNNAFLQGTGYIGYDDSEANIKALVNGVTPLNSQNLCFIGNRAVTGVNVVITPPDWRAAEFIAIKALRRTDGAADICLE